MDHIAIMNKKWKMIEKILSGRKTIESRWYIKKSRRPQVEKGDSIYFRNSGGPVIAKVKAESIKTFDNLSPKDISNLLKQFGKDIGIEPEEEEKFYKALCNKQFAMLIELENPKKIEPFSVYKKKTGYCTRAAWMTVDDISKYKTKSS